ncbi:oxygen-regulated protein 1 [Scomber japonicus]|uniref:oxygen-regulated protein 1 n=1 Tax=Scomber japonicus TaxID=13676 RepID=UPI0023058749|nr:oxygen-regulated protein 1 [Scomber japonicus]
MSSTPLQEPLAQGLSSGSGQTLPSRLLQPIPDPSASKRVCFYKSGDSKFSGHRMVINARTFKTFDALLDALSKKVPLPFGVRTITTPRGTHLVKALDDLQDGGSYVCSDQKRVKPLNLDEVNRRQVPWNTTRPPSAGRRRRKVFQFGRTNEVINKPAKISERVAIRTPKRLVVIKNRDPTVKRTIVLQRRTAPTFEALLDYLSQILQFPVLKLYSTDGRRVGGLSALILCSGVVVAAGNEPFRLTNYSFHSMGQMAQAMYIETVEPSMLQPQAQNNKSLSSGRGSRNFSLSSEQYIINQINNSRNGSTNSHQHHHHGSAETEVNPHHSSVESCGDARVDNEVHTCIVPQDDDIEKSFRVNQDGSMTVEMKVRLTIKEEEMLHWTTTLSRSSLSKTTAYASISESGNSSPDLNNAVANDSSSISEDEAKKENHPAVSGEGVSFKDEQVYEGYTSTALGRAKASFKRVPTPGPRHIKKNASIESVTRVTPSGVQESTLGHYSYMERTADGEATEGYCVVRHSSSSSSRPVPKPRKTASAGLSKKSSHSSIRSSGVAEVLQIENNGMEVRETVMHIYESQDCYSNYLANAEYSADGASLPGPSSAPVSKQSIDSRPHSSSNDCDIDFSWQPPTGDSLQRQKEEMLSLSSEPIREIPNNLSSVAENESQTASNSQTTGEKKKVIKPSTKQRVTPSTSSSGKKQKESIVGSSKNSKHSSTDKISSNASMGKKSLSSSESVKSRQKSKTAEKHELKKSIKDEKTPRKESALSLSSENIKKTPPKKQNINNATAKDNAHNVNNPSGRPQMKKNLSDILQPKKSLLPGKKQISKPKSMIDNQLLSPKTSLELSESVSMPSLNPSPSDIHQYVENWLEKVSSDPVPYMEEEADASGPQPKVVFKIGGDSESEEKSDCQNNPEEYYPSLGDAVKKSTSCLSVPHSHEGPATTLQNNDQKARGLCVSMPSVRVEPAVHENRLRSHKSAEIISPVDSESPPSSSNILSPKARIKPVLRQICSSIQCIRTMPDTNKTSNLEKSNSLPDFSTQVASVFGSSCKAFLSFLSVMTLRDNLTGSAPIDETKSDSEAMFMLESLQKISTIDDQEELRASLTDLESRASSQLRDRWKDFQILRERLESEPLSPKFSETEFALDVVSEVGDVFEDQHMGIDELMDELNMPQDVRAEISSTIQQVRSFYPVEESTFLETERHHSDTEEEVEQFVEKCKESPDPENTCMAENITEGKLGNEEDPSHTGETNDLNEMQNISDEQAKIMNESEQELNQSKETNLDVKESDVSQPETDEPLIEKENEMEVKEEEGQIEEEVEEDMEVNDLKEIDNNDGGRETENEDREREEEAEEEALREDDKGKEEWEADKGSGEESVVKEDEETEKEITVDGEEEQEKLEEVEEEEVAEEAEDGFMDDEGEEERGYNSVAETDERDGAEETEEGEEAENIIKESDEEVENIIEVVENEEEEDDEGKEEAEAGDVVEDNDDEVENIEGEEEEEQEEEEEDEGKEEDAGEVIEEWNEEVENIIEGVEEEKEEKDVDEEAEKVTQESDEEQNTIEGAEEEEEGSDDSDDEVENIEGVEEDEQEEEEDEEEEDNEEEAEDVIEDKDEEVENIEVEMEEDEKDEDEEEEDNEEEAEDVIEDKDEEVENIEVEMEEDEEDVEGETKAVIEKGDEVENIEGVEEEEEDVEEEAEEVTQERNDEGENIEEEEDVEEEAEEVNQEREEEVENIEAEDEEEEEGGKEEEEVEEVTEDRDEEVENIERVEEDEEEEEEEGNEEEAEDIVEERDDEVENIDELEEEEEGEKEEEEENVEEEAEERHEVDNITEEVEEQKEEEEEDGEIAELEEESIEEKEIVEAEEENVGDDEGSSGDGADNKSLLEEASYLRQHRSSCEKDEANYEANTDIKETEHRTESPTKYSTEGQCEDDKGTNGTDTINDIDTDEGGDCHDESGSLPHPVEISQELLDFVNSALQSSSLIFIYDDRGNIRIEPDNARVVQINQALISESRKDTSYGLKCLPSPSTSDLSDYRPETSESGGYKSQGSIDIVSESGDEVSERPPPVYRHSAHRTERENVERANSSKSKLSVASNSEVSHSSRLKSGGSFSSHDSSMKASREDLSYFSAASSLKAEAEAATEATQCISFGSDKDLNDGVLIDKGRWLLKENHLIRKSPPISLGMYGNVDSTSIDTGQDNTSEDSSPHYKTQNNPLAAISSSELEEMAKPQTPKCTYYNMPHGSDSDPFLDDDSVKSGKKDSSSKKGRGVRVSPTIDTSKTWANKNGSLSSFASVEFKVSDRKVHPEGESSAVTQARGTSGAARRVLQAQDSLETLHVRCGQYCPIL